MIGGWGPLFPPPQRYSGGHQLIAAPRLSRGITPHEWTILLVFALAGCATAEPSRVLTDVQTQVVHVPTPTPCEAAIPKRPASAMPKPDAAGKVEVDQGTAGALADVRALRDPGQYLDQIDVILKKCVKDISP